VDGQKQDIIERRTWDSSSRLIEEIDPNGNSTRHLYNARDLLVSTTFADGTERRFDHDLRDRLIQSSDPNGTVVKYEYDSLDRLVRKSITPGAGVSGAITFEEFRHDGLSRLIGARNDLSAASFSYDALSRLTRETLDQRATAYDYDPAGNIVTLTYPGGMTVHYSYDALDREVSVGIDQDCCAVVKSAEYAGPDRLLGRVLGNGLQSSWEYDQVRRKVHGLHHGENQAPPVSDRLHAWDAMYRLVESADQLPGGVSHGFVYDPAHRLIGSAFASSGTPPRTTAYSLDPASNRLEVLGAIDPGRYILDPTFPEPADFQMNQYTATPFDQRTYDRNGNLLRFSRPLVGRIVEVACTYDHADRLVEVADPASGEKVSFTYDPLGRRSSASAGGASGARSYSGMQLIEDGRRGAVYVYSGGQPIAYQQGGQGFFILHDGTGNAAALADGQGNLVENYEYGDYGLPRLFDPQGNPMQESKAANPFLREGLEYDADTGLYYACASGVHFDPRAGRNVNSKNGNTYAMYSIQKAARTRREPDSLVFNIVNPRAARLGLGGGGGGGGTGFFKSVSGLESETEVVPYREGGVNDSTHMRPGPTRFSHIVLKRGVTKSKSFFQWVASAANREVKRMGGKISLCRSDDSPVIDWAFERAYPVKWEGPELDASKNEISIETVEIAHHGIEFDSVGLPGKPLRGRVPITFTVTDPEARDGFQQFFEVPRPGKPPADRSSMSDNGWGSCFNCHPFGLESQANMQKESRRFQTLSNASKARHTHDTVKNSINNVR
jgi:phage tail-like protein